MYPSLAGFRLALIVALFSVTSVVAFADAKSAADYLPATTVLYAEITSPTDLVNVIQNHPLRKKLEAMDEYQQLTEENPDYLKARAGLGIFEFVVGRDWDQAITDIAGDGLFVGVDAATEGAILMAHARNADALAEIRDRLLKAAKDDAARKGKEVDFEEKDYRGHTIYKTNDAVAGVIGEWLVVTNKPELGRAVADRLLDGGENSLAAKASFMAAQKSVAGKPAAWAYADIQKLRDAAVAKQLYQEKSDNFGLELLAGGILAALQQADAGTAALYLEDDQLRLAFQVPHDGAAIPEQREFYFGKEGKGAAPAPLTLKNQLASITAHRNVGELWRRRSDLFNENVNAQLAESDSQLSTVFAGLDFGREVLGSLQPQSQIVATLQNFEDRKTNVPTIKLPATAMVFQLKQPEKMRRQLKVSFQSIVGLTNLGAGQNELPQLELKTEEIDGGQLVSATYENLPDDDEVANDIIYNFSPSVAFVGDHFILSSTRELAVELMPLAKPRPENTKPRPVVAQVAENSAKRTINTRMTVESEMLQKILAANSETLIAQNMLEEGHSRKEAEKEIGLLLTLLTFAGDLSVELATEDGNLQLEIQVGRN